MSFRNMWKADKKCEVMDLDYCEKKTLEDSKVWKPGWKIMNMTQLVFYLHNKLYLPQLLSETYALICVASNHS